MQGHFTLCEASPAPLFYTFGVGSAQKRENEMAQG